MEGLEDEAVMLAPQPRQRVVVQARELVAAEEDLALIDRLEAGDGVEERRLADARLADHGDVLTRGELERYLVQHGSSAVALADSDEPEHS